MAELTTSKRARKIVESKYAAQSEKYKALAEHYYTIAHKADTRMRALEKLSEQEGYENVKKYAYRKAVHELHGKTRFEQTISIKGDDTNKVVISYQSLVGRVNAIERFLVAPSSTKKGIYTVYAKRAETLNKNNGTNLTWEEIAKASQVGALDKLKEKYGSSAMFITLGVFKESSEEELKTIKKADETHEITGDEVLDKKIQKALRDNSIGWKKLGISWDNIN